MSVKLIILLVVVAGCALVLFGLNRADKIKGDESWVGAMAAIVGGGVLVLGALITGIVRWVFL